MPIKILECFIEIEKVVVKFIWKGTEAHESKNNFEKDNEKSY
jgi:hypothetical protein